MTDNTNEIVDNTAQDPLDENSTWNAMEDKVAENEEMNENLTENSEIDKMLTEIGQWKDKYMRLAAEFDNYKKRSFKEKMDVIQTAGKDVIMTTHGDIANCSCMHAR